MKIKRGQVLASNQDCQDWIVWDCSEDPDPISGPPSDPSTVIVMGPYGDTRTVAREELALTDSFIEPWKFVACCKEEYDQVVSQHQS